MFVKTKDALVGRSNQAYSSSTGARLVAGCVVYDSTTNKILMVSSSKNPNKWIIPKGGVENGESFEEAAMRETWEEAGVTGELQVELGVVEDKRPPKEWSDSEIPRSEFHFFVMKMTELCDTWPESSKRNRKWVTVEEGIGELERAKRPELVDVLEQFARL